MLFFFLSDWIQLRGENAEHIVFTHDDVLGAGYLGLGSGVFSEQNPVAGFDVEGDQIAVVESLAMTRRDDFAFLRFLLGGIGNDDAVARGFLFVDALHYNAVV